MRRSQPNREKKTCAQCKKEFMAREGQKFCSKGCKDGYFNDIKYEAMEHYRTCPLVKGKKHE